MCGFKFFNCLKYYFKTSLYISFVCVENLKLKNRF